MSEKTGKNVIILGAKGTCVDIIDIINSINKKSAQPSLALQGFLDDNPGLKGARVEGYPVLGLLKDAALFPDSYFIHGISSPGTFRQRDVILEKTGIPPERFISVIHPSAEISPSANIGRGVVIFPQVTVHNHAHIDDHVLILAGSVLNHDCRVGAYVTIASRVVVCGGVSVGTLSYLGAQSTIREYAKVGSRVMVGMGSNVVKDVPDGKTVMGNPAREKS